MKTAFFDLDVALADVREHERQSAAVMIGDRMHDVAAGKRCGTGTIGVT